MRDRFPSIGAVPGSPAQSVYIIPAKHPDVGNIEIHDDGAELTLYLGRFTHTHISNYERDLSEDQKAEAIVSDALSFLGSIFEDQVVLWGTSKGSGGCYRVDHERNRGIRTQGPLYVWSGPYGVA